jgi:hypothetical protein
VARRSSLVSLPLRLIDDENDPCEELLGLPRANHSASYCETDFDPYQGHKLLGPLGGLLRQRR